MDKIFDLFSELATNKHTKDDIRKFVNDGKKYLDKGMELLKTTDPERICNKFLEVFPKSIMKAYDDGKISEEALEEVRKFGVIYPSELSDNFYKLTAALLELAKSEKARSGESAS